MAWEEYMEKKRHTTASGEDYLEAIFVLQKKLGMVRSVDVARYMAVSYTHLQREWTKQYAAANKKVSKEGWIWKD